MRFLLTVLSLIFLLPCVPAQTLTVSEEIPLRTDTEYYIVGKQGGHVLMFQDRGTKHFLTGYGRNMNQNWEKELELRGRNVKLLETQERADGSGFCLLYFYRESGRRHLQLDIYSPAGDLKDSVTLAQFQPFILNPDDLVVSSQDNSKALVLIAETQSRVRCIGVDLMAEEDMLLFDRTLEPEKFFFNEHFLQAEISNEGEMIFVAERDNFRSKRKDHRYEVFVTGPASPTVVTQEVSFGDSLTYDIAFRYDNANRRMTAAGLYTTKDMMRADGYFFVTFSPTAVQNVRPVFNRFPVSLIRNVEGKKFNKKRPALDEISVRDIVLRRDGGVVLVTERNRQMQRRSTAAQLQVMNTYNGRPLVDHYYNEIIAFGIHPDGSPHWSNIMHKKQYSQDDGGVFSSYFMMESPRAVRFLFNDEIRFENTVSEYVMNGRGEFDRNSLFHTRDLDLRLRFRDGIQVAANEIIVPSELRNRLRLVKVTYESK